MVGGRMLMDTPALDVELLAVKKRLSELEEQVRTLSAANLALVRAMEGLDERVRAREDDRPLAPTL
ncbi:hypothetical protein ACI2LC_18925 [Nonomuraea wenchangensis]|uniref:Uncharacterized protein n=1 Tax=Nonomuraea wenchangensis TaxID=568860 RepID=A0A1I0KP90_9ACTN|nr:hypothetical protein [Nonomuraea wenchangensis]SEU26306.1 hypothetical protein SAMN05421811_108402 [Nonomuraea wenchangensis]